MNFEKFKSFNLSEFDSPNPIDRKRNRLFSLKSVLMTHRNDVIIRVIHVVIDIDHDNQWQILRRP